MADDINAVLDRLGGTGQQAPASKGGPDKGALLRLAALIPLALAKGGQPAVSGLLAGYQQAKLRKQQQGMQQGQIDWQQQYQQAQLTRQDAAEARMNQTADLAADDRRLGLQRQFLEQIRTQAGDPDLSMEEAMQRMDVFGRMAPQYGLTSGDVQQAAFVAPTRREKARIERALANVDKMYPPTPEREQLQLSDLGMSVGEARQRVSGATGAAPVVKPAANAVNAGSFEDFTNEKDPARRAQLLADRKAYMQSDDRPRLGGGAGGPTDAQSFSMSERLAKAWVTANAPIREMDRQLRLMETGLKRFRTGDANGGSQAVLVTFQKILDPASVVRESEYARTTDGQALLARIEGYATRLAQGGTTLTDRELAAMVQTARDMFSGMSQWTAGTRGRLEAQTRRYGLDPATVFDDVLTGNPGQQQAPAAPAGGPAVGERRTINGQLGEWDGKGWKAVGAQSAPRRPAMAPSH